MDTAAVFLMGAMNRDKEPMVFDWDKAAALIVERGATYAEAGLQCDWDWTAGTIFKNGAPVPAENTYTYLASTWATPQILIDGEYVDCFRMAGEVPDWDEKTYWPESALARIGGAE